ncbi:hypothetical protein BOTBODRAFT_39277 [Botryobasidium botryosum FD-172 SS1]|uniref:Uncharacterized protein n=1 Tax=Botryobasidium botryosum (strain FD-172 SS1) TaxID=930990 RepID=A0A067LUS7_BOTB1|nr:hypothetical protein BOTBODRAFT_39277 [Botryobasidium botryosum FD-172 SS1]
MSLLVLDITGADLAKVTDATLIGLFSDMGTVATIYRWQNPEPRRAHRHVFIEMAPSTFDHAETADFTRDGWRASVITDSRHSLYEAYIRAKSLPPIRQDSKQRWATQIASMEKARETVAANRTATPSNAADDNVDDAPDHHATTTSASTSTSSAAPPPTAPPAAVPPSATPPSATPRRLIITLRILPSSSSSAQPAPSQHVGPAPPPNASDESAPAPALMAAEDDARPAKRQCVDTLGAFVAVGKIINTTTTVLTERRAHARREKELSDALAAERVLRETAEARLTGALAALAAARGAP